MELEQSMIKEKANKYNESNTYNIKPGSTLNLVMSMWSEGRKVAPPLDLSLGRLNQ